MPQTAVIQQGDFSTAFEIEPARWSVRYRDLDRVVLTYCAPTENYFTRGGNAPSPYNAFVIEDFEEETDVTGEVIYTLTCLGVRGSTERLVGKMLPRRVMGDWDTVDFEWITQNAARFREGQMLAGGAWTAMVCTDVQPEHMIGNWLKLRVSGKGIAGPKSSERKITCNGMTISGDAVKWQLPGGWNVAQKGVVDLPQIVVTDTYWTTSPPPTSDVPGSRVPPNTPPIKDLGSVTFASSSAVHYWPNGWKFTVAGEQLGNASLWRNDFIYTVQWSALPST